MGQLDFRRFAWGVHRWFLIRGSLAWVIVFGAAALLLALLAFAISVREYRDLGLRLEHLTTVPVEVGIDLPPEPPPFPMYSERFEQSARTLAALRIGEALAGKVVFTYDSSEVSGLVKQTATMNVEARWQDVGGLIERVQAASPTGYISRLRIVRDTAQDALVGAEVQFTQVYRDIAKDDPK